MSVLLSVLGMFVVAPQAAAVQEVKAWVRGRALLPDGSPAKRATVNLTTRQTPPDGGRRRTTPSAPVETGSMGGFSIWYVPSPEAECVLTVALQGYETLVWEWDEHPVGGPKTLPAQKFPEPCYLTGSIVGGDGQLLMEGWQVHARPKRELLAVRSGSYSRSTPDPKTGEFRVGPLTPGEVVVYANHGGMARTESVTVRIRPGEPDHVVLTYDGPDLFSSVVIDAKCALYFGLSLGWPYLETGAVPGKSPSYLFLLDQDGSVLSEAVQPEGIRGSHWCFLDVPMGEYVVELRHPWFDPVRVEGVIPGGTYPVALVGTAEIQLEVLTSEGHPHGDYELGIRYSGDQIPSRTYPLLKADEPVPEGGLFQGIVPGNSELVLRSLDGERLAIELGELKPGETRRVQAQLIAALPMEVLVVDSDGQPVDGIGVYVAMGTVDDVNRVERSDMHRFSRSLQSPKELLQTGSDGRLTVVDAIPGQWTLRAIASRYADVTRTLEHPLPDEGLVVLELPALGRLEGQLHCTEGFDWSTVEMNVHAKREGGTFRWAAWPPEESLIDANGAFVLEGLAEGQLMLYLQLDDPDFSEDGKSTQITTQTVEITAGTQQWELDLEGHLPAPCELLVQVDGEPLAGARVALVSQKRMVRYEKRVRVRQLLGSEGTTGSNGRVLVPWLKHDEAYVAFVAGDEGAWITDVGSVEGQAYQDPARLQASLSLIEREVLVRGPSGTTFPKTEFGWTCRSLTTKLARAVTNEASTMFLRMPPGTYSLYRADQRRPELIEFEWQTGDGPLVIEMPEDE